MRVEAKEKQLGRCWLSRIPNATFHRHKKSTHGKPMLFAGTFEEILDSPALKAEFEAHCRNCAGSTSTPATLPSGPRRALH